MKLIVYVNDCLSWVISLVKWLYVLWFKTPMVSSNVIALMFSEARIASLSAKVGSSFDGTLAERITHISHKFTFTARRSARLSGEPCNQYFLSTHHFYQYIYIYIYYLMQIHIFRFNILLTLSTDIFGRFWSVFHSLRI